MKKVRTSGYMPCSINWGKYVYKSSLKVSCEWFHMVNTSRTRNPRRRSNVQEEEMQDLHEERTETPQGNPLSGGNQGEGTRMDQMERVMESMVTLMRAMQPAGQIIPRNSNVSDRFQ